MGKDDGFDVAYEMAPSSKTRSDVSLPTSEWPLFPATRTTPTATEKHHHDAKDTFPKPSASVARRPLFMASGLRPWTFELIGLTISFGLFAAVLGILIRFNGHEVPSWPFSINLNTAIALLATFFRASLMVSVAGMLSQLKWAWFTTRTPRPLTNLDNFDQASRSVIGSLNLLRVLCRSGGHGGRGLGVGTTATLAAMVMAVSFTIGPFTQQALKSAACLQLDQGRASVPVANFVPGTTKYFRTGAGWYQVDVDFKAAGIRGLTQKVADAGRVEAVCATGNCTFNDFGTGVTHSTIGLCSACRDTTEQVVGPDESGNLSLPSNPNLLINLGPYQTVWLSVGTSNFSWAADLFPEDVASASLSNVSVLSVTDAPCKTLSDSPTIRSCPHNTTAPGDESNGWPSDYVAVSCALYPCLKSYKGLVRDGVLNETLVSTTPAHLDTLDISPGVTDVGFAGNRTALRAPCPLNGTIFDPRTNLSQAHTLFPHTTMSMSSTFPAAPVPDQCLYKMSGAYALAIQQYFSNDLLTGYCSYNNMQAGSLYCDSAWWLAPLHASKNATFASISSQMEGLARVLTDLLRQTGFGAEGGHAGAQVRGVVTRTSVCVYLDWRWLLMPACMVFMVTCLLAAVVARTKCSNGEETGVPVWKESSLPLLFYGLRNGEEAKGAAQSAMTRSQVEDMAGGMLVRLRTGAKAGFEVVKNAGAEPAM